MGTHSPTLHCAVLVTSGLRRLRHGDGEFEVNPDYIMRLLSVRKGKGKEEEREGEQERGRKKGKEGRNLRPHLAQFFILLRTQWFEK